MSASGRRSAAAPQTGRAPRTDPVRDRRVPSSAPGSTCTGRRGGPGGPDDPIASGKAFRQRLRARVNRHGVWASGSSRPPPLRACRANPGSWASRPPAGRRRRRPAATLPAPARSAALAGRCHRAAGRAPPRRDRRDLRRGHRRSRGPIDRAVPTARAHHADARAAHR